MKLGIDEAGRGCVYGPLVLSGVLADALAQAELENLGVMDSKKFSGDRIRAHKKRSTLAKQIHELCLVRTALVLPDVIDKNLLKRVTRPQTLNQIEMAMAVEVIEFFMVSSFVSEIVLDGSLFHPLENRYKRLRAENKADSTDIVVSAASICAKSARDQLCLASMGIDGFVRGGGYPNKKTEEWLFEQVAVAGRLPVEVRRSWSWCEKVGLLQVETMHKQSSS